MGFIAKCSNCGANIEADDTKDAGICKFCNAAIVAKKAIDNSIANVNKIENAIQYATKNTYGSTDKPPMDFEAEADEAMKINFYSGYAVAFRLYQKALGEEPRVYEKLFEALKQSILYGDLDVLLKEIKENNFGRYFKIYKTLVSPQKAEKIKSEYQASINLNSKRFWEQIIKNDLKSNPEFTNIKEWLDYAKNNLDYMVEEKQIIQSTADKIWNAVNKFAPQEIPNFEDEEF